MHICEMFVAVIVMVVGNHLVWLAFEAHALIASAAGYPIAAVCPLDWHLATLIWTFSDSIILQVFFECCISALLGLLACQPRMVVQFAFNTVRLLALIAAEVLLNEEVYLLAASGIAVGNYFRISSHVLI